MAVWFAVGRVISNGIVMGSREAGDLSAESCPRWCLTDSPSASSNFTAIGTVAIHRGEKREWNSQLSIGLQRADNRFSCHKSWALCIILYGKHPLPTHCWG
jgi:hypothetical protein